MSVGHFYKKVKTLGTNYKKLVRIKQCFLHYKCSCLANATTQPSISVNNLGLKLVFFPLRMFFRMFFSLCHGGIFYFPSRLENVYLIQRPLHIIERLAIKESLLTRADFHSPSFKLACHDYE